MVATGLAIGLLANNVVEELTVLEVSGLQLVKVGIQLATRALTHDAVRELTMLAIFGKAGICMHD